MKRKWNREDIFWLVVALLMLAIVVSIIWPMFQRWLYTGIGG
jgi:type II secretory pathway component PulL